MSDWNFPPSTLCLLNLVLLLYLSEESGPISSVSSNEVVVDSNKVPRGKAEG